MQKDSSQRSLVCRGRLFTLNFVQTIRAAPHRVKVPVAYRVGRPSVIQASKSGLSIFRESTTSVFVGKSNGRTLAVWLGFAKEPLGFEDLICPCPNSSTVDRTAA